MINTKEKIYIVRCGEVALKGQNKPYFERMLVQRIKKILNRAEDEALKSSLGKISVERNDGLIFVRTPLDVSEAEILKRVGRVFGVESISPAKEIAIENMTADEVIDEVGRVAAETMLGIIE